VSNVQQRTMLAQLKVRILNYGYIPIVLLFLCSLTFLVLSGEKNTQNLLSFAAEKNASALSVSLETFRGLYTKEVISKLNNSDFTVGHMYHSDDKIIPLPANMTFMLGEKIKQIGSGAYASLYSPYPYPWRTEKGGLTDSFKEQAWLFLSENPTKRFTRLETIEGKIHLRYAKADIMQSASCVDCHNSHPQSPKRNWKLGEVRGILEVSQPLESVFAEGRKATEQQLHITFVAGMFGILAIALVIFSYRHQLAKLMGLQASLESRASELEQFSYRSSHDLKAPLTSAKRLAKFVIEDIESGNLTEAKGNTAIIYAQMEKLEDLVTDILDLAKADLQQTSADIIDFDEIFDDTKAKLFYLIDEVEIELSISVELTRAFYGEKARFTQIIENLVSNSIKYKSGKRSHSYVRVRVFKVRKTLHIEVCDNGVGIPPEYHAKMFTMFQRFHPKLNSGSGLGLAIVKKHVEHMQGQISCESSPEGTTFSISLPYQTSKHNLN